MSRAELYAIAKWVRTWAEDTAGPLSWIGPDLDSFCALGARKLFRELRKAGHPARLGLSRDCHVYVLCYEYVVDVTASQFGQPRVVVRLASRIKKDGSEDWWDQDAVFRSDRSLLRRLRRDDWSECCLTLPAARSQHREEEAHDHESVDEALANWRLL